MKQVILLLSAIVMALSLLSCGNEEEQFENIEFDTTGISLSKPSGISYYAEIGSNGGVITITAKGKNAANGFLSEVKVGNFFYEVNPADLKHEMPVTICNEDWGSIELLSSSPYSVRIRLLPNKTDNSINYELTFGAGYRTSHILLTQLRNQ